MCNGIDNIPKLIVATRLEYPYLGITNVVTYYTEGIKSKSYDDEILIVNYKNGSIYFNNKHICKTTTRLQNVILKWINQNNLCITHYEEVIDNKPDELDKFFK
jgi:hypothetical protein